jgi:hypothetical protein
MLRERLDRHQRLERLRQLPILGKLRTAERCPLADQSQCARRQRPVQDVERSELDLGDVLSGA